MRTYDVEFTMTFRSQIEAESDEDARRILAGIGTGDVWENGDDWTLDDTSKRVSDCYDDETGTSAWTDPENIYGIPVRDEE